MKKQMTATEKYAQDMALLFVGGCCACGIIILAIVFFVII